MAKQIQGEDDLQRVPIRSQREARRLHAEQKGEKLEGSQQQRSIKEFLSKLKDKKNSTEVLQKLAERRGRTHRQTNLERFLLYIIVIFISIFIFILIV